MPEQDPFISVSDLEAILGSTIANPNSLQVKIALDSACQSVRTYLGQTINYVTNDVEVHSGGGRRKLRLRERPVRAVNTVTVDDEVVPATDYTVRKAIITMKDTGTWSYGNDNVSVNYNHGYDISEPSDNNVPADIRLVALLSAKRVYTTLGAVIGAGGVTAETIGDYSYTLSDDVVSGKISAAAGLFDAEKYVLDRYRIDLIGDTPTF